MNDNNSLNNKIKKLEREVKKLKSTNKRLEYQLIEVTNSYNLVLNSKTWRITKPIRVINHCIKKILLKFPPTRLAIKFIKSCIRIGVRKTFKKIFGKFFPQSNKITKKQLEKQRKTKFANPIKFSILVPLYNTPKKFLEEMIGSVTAQTYSNWELCLADGSDSNYKYVESICKKYTNKDSRIKYQKLEKNLGISENTNACIKMSTGDYISLFDHDDLLHPSALYENAKVINEKNADFIYTDEASFIKKIKNITLKHFKSDFAIDTLRSYNYICHFTTFNKKLLDEVGAFRAKCDGSQDYDLILRLTEKAQKIVHIPKILYYWRVHKNSVASDISAKTYTIDAAKLALSDHLKRCDLKAQVTDARVLSTYKIDYEIESQPLISIIIPNKDCVEDLSKCINSIFEMSTYKNFEIIIVENNSVKKSTFDYYKQLTKNNSNIKIVTWEGKFNYSAINNFGFKFTKGEHILLLNNDIEVISENWLEEMLMYSQRQDIGAVGAMLYYPDDTVQHGGVILGVGGIAGHAHKNFKRNAYGYMTRLCIAQNFSAVTAACMMMPRKVFELVNGLDEKFEVAFNDIDLCMRIRKAGFNIVWTPYAELYHYESKSRGSEDTPQKKKRFEGEVLRFQKRWAKELKAGDPFYNSNLTLDREDFSPK